LCWQSRFSPKVCVGPKRPDDQDPSLGHQLLKN
jgi:hypothetical protein